jgi:GNAT superfamily N-acetyltransferase
MIIRQLTARDRQGWGPLWQAYLDFYRTTIGPEVTDTCFTRLSAPERDDMIGLVAELPTEELIGFVHLVFHPNTWSVAGVCYLEDLFVSEKARGQGTGRALIGAASDLAAERGVKRLYWRTEGDNDTARRLYRSVAHEGDWVMYEITL